MPSVPYWFVYKVMKDDRIVYIGKGANDRHKASAKKHGGVGEILCRFEKETEAFEFEMLLIAEIQPSLNRSAGGDGGISAERIRKREKAAERRGLAIERKWQREWRQGANKGEPLSLLCVLGTTRQAGQFDEFNRFLKIAKSLPEWKPHPIWDGVKETFNKLEYIQIPGQ